MRRITSIENWETVSSEFVGDNRTTLFARCAFTDIYVIENTCMFEDQTLRSARVHDKIK